MGLRFKFNLVLSIITLLGLAGSGLISYQILQQNARQEVLEMARMMMESAVAVRGYTVSEIKPLLTVQQRRAFIPQTYTVLGTDGFGRSDTRANLRRFFEVDRYYIAHAAIAALAADGKMTGKDVARAIKQYKIDVEKVNPVTV